MGAASAAWKRDSRRGAALRMPRCGPRLRWVREAGVWELKPIFLASAEGDDAPDRIVRGYPDGDAVAWNNLDSKTAHTAAQLRENFVALVTLHAVQTAAVNRNHGPLHVDKIILAQVLSFPIKDCATSASEEQTQQSTSDAERMTRPAC
jgi:hypothetical protein